jgi:GNAT superfamily N-acetyltransferase
MQLELRTYEPKDIPRITELVMTAIPQLPNYAMVTPDRDRIQYVLEHNIDNGQAFGGWVVCDKQDIVQGFIGAWCVHSLLSFDLVADDIFLWIESEYRDYQNARKLVNAYTVWAREKGAKLIRATHTGGSWPKGSREYELFDTLLNRFGFSEVGSVYHLSTYGDK